MVPETRSVASAVAGDGANRLFDASFRADTKAEIGLYVIEADGSLTFVDDDNFSVTGLGEDGGFTVTYPIAPVAAIPNTKKVVLFRNPAFGQGSAIGSQGSFAPKTHEDAFDRAEKVAQFFRDVGSKRTIRAFPGDTDDVDLTLPGLASRGGKALGFAANGKTLVLFDSPATAIELVTAAVSTAQSARDEAVEAAESIGDAVEVTGTNKDLSITAKTAAEAARDLAQAWAISPDPVTPGNRSAKYWAEQAAAIVNGDIVASAVDFTPTGTIAADNVQGAIGELEAEKQAISAKGQANGYASLDADGLVPASQMPLLAISDTHEVANEAAMLALTAQKGDIAIRTDENKTYVLASNSPSTLADWKLMRTPTDLVLAVAGLTGTITASALRAALSMGNAYDLARSVAGDFRKNVNNVLLTPEIIWGDAAPFALTSGTNVSINFEYLNFTLALAHNATLQNPTNIKLGQKGTFYVSNVNAYNLAFASYWKPIGASLPAESGTEMQGSYDVKTATEIHFSWQRSL